MVAAPVALLRLAFGDARSKGRKLLIKFATAAVRTGTLSLAVGRFQEFTYLAAITALIFKNRHTETPVQIL